MRTALRVDKLSLAYGKRQILRELSFSVAEGELLVITGPSGCGKTSLCHILSGIIPNAIKGQLTGEVALAGQALAGLPLARVATMAGLVFQDAGQQLICTTVEDELAFGLENLCLPAAQIRARVEQTLHDFGMEEWRLRNPARLSGGQQRLLAVAAVLILAPPVLILDEPYSGLDEAGRQLLQQAIAAQRAAGRTIIMVEHDLHLAQEADRWLILQQGRIALLDTPAALLARRAVLEELGIWL